MTSNGNDESPRYCVHCYTPVKHTSPDPAVYPDGLLVSTVDQGMRHLSVCPRRPLMMGYPQPHEMGPRRWVPVGEPSNRLYNPPLPRAEGPAS